MNQRMKVINEEWQRLENYLLQEDHQVFARLIPLLKTAKSVPLLQQLYPYLSHERLCLSYNTSYPWSYEYPCAEPIPNIVEFGMLSKISETNAMGINVFTRWITQILDQCQISHQSEESYLELDEEGVIVGINDRSSFVTGLLEQTYGVYRVYENSKVGLTENKLLGVTDVKGATELLVSRVKNLNSTEFE
jgi:hypothetical protein